MKNQSKLMLKCALAVAAGLVVASAQAKGKESKPPAPPVACGDSSATVGNAGYLDCRGPIGGNVNGNASEAVYLTSQWGTNWTWQGESGDAGAGPFSANQSGLLSGTLSFDSAVKGLFVLAIKGGPDYSYYEFNGGVAGITSLQFDTLGITKGNGNPGPGLSHFGLYTALAPVPEPESYALMIAGLGVVGFIVRRRKQQA